MIWQHGKYSSETRDIGDGNKCRAIMKLSTGAWEWFARHQNGTDKDGKPITVRFVRGIASNRDEAMFAAEDALARYASSSWKTTTQT